MMLHKKRMFCFALTSIAFALSQQASAETLHDIVARSIQYNPDVRIAEKIKSASNEDVYQARSGYFPTLDVTAGWGRERASNVNTGFNPVNLWRTDFGINARQMIFDGFATPSEVARNKAKTNADAYKVWGTAEDIALSTVQSYLDVLRNTELVSIAEKNVHVHSHTFGMIKRMGEQGIGRTADTDQTSGRLDLARANLITAQNNLQDAKINFQKITGMLPHALMHVSDVHNSSIPKSEEEALRMAFEYHPILKSALADMAEARGQYESSKSKFYPRLDLVVSARHNHNTGGVHGKDDDRLAELQLQYNLLQGGKDIARTRQTVYEIQRACAIRDRTQRQVIESMKLSWTAYRNASARIPQLVSHKNASAATRGAYQKQFELSKRTLLDVLDSQNEYFTAEQDLTNERYALLFAKYRILHDMGKLISYLNVPLPVEAHVPYKIRELY